MTSSEAEETPLLQMSQFLTSLFGTSAPAFLVVLWHAGLVEPWALLWEFGGAVVLGFAFLLMFWSLKKEEEFMVW